MVKGTELIAERSPVAEIRPRLAASLLPGHTGEAPCQMHHDQESENVRAPIARKHDVDRARLISGGRICPLRALPRFEAILDGPRMEAAPEALGISVRHWPNFRSASDIGRARPMRKGASLLLVRNS